MLWEEYVSQVHSASDRAIPRSRGSKGSFPFFNGFACLENAQVPGLGRRASFRRTKRCSRIPSSSLRAVRAFANMLWPAQRSLLQVTQGCSHAWPSVPLYI